MLMAKQKERHAGGDVTRPMISSYSGGQCAALVSQQTLGHLSTAGVSGAFIARAMACAHHRHHLYYQYH